METKLVKYGALNVCVDDLLVIMFALLHPYEFILLMWPCYIGLLYYVIITYSISILLNSSYILFLVVWFIDQLMHTPIRLLFFRPRIRSISVPNPCSVISAFESATGQYPIRSGSVLKIWYRIR